MRLNDGHHVCKHELMHVQLKWLEVNKFARATNNITMNNLLYDEHKNWETIIMYKRKHLKQRI